MPLSSSSSSSSSAFSPPPSSQQTKQAAPGKHHMQRTPLLEEHSTTPPSLSAGPDVEVHSEFTRLLMTNVVNTNPALPDDEDGGGVDWTTSLLHDDEAPHSHNLTAAVVDHNNPAVWRRGPLAVALAGAFCVLHVTWMGWAVAGNHAWSDTRIRVDLLEWPSPALVSRFVERATPTITSTSLLQIVQELGRTHHVLWQIVVVVAAVGLPALVWMISPTWILAPVLSPTPSGWDVVARRKWRYWNIRGLLLEGSLRWCFAVVWIVLLLQVAVASLELEWTDTHVRVGYCAGPPLAAYTAGLAAALAVVVILRWPQPSPAVVRVLGMPPEQAQRVWQRWKQHHQLVAEDDVGWWGGLTTPKNDNDDENEPAAAVENSTMRTPLLCPRRRSPPLVAGDSHENDDGEPEEPTMTVLEETTRDPTHTSTTATNSITTATGASAPSSPNTEQQQASPAHNNNNTAVTTAATNRSNNTAIPVFYRVLAFEMGLVALLLWIPATTLPLVEFRYGGLATHFLSESVIRLYLGDILRLLWRHGLLFGTPLWIVLLVLTVLVMLTLLIPLAVTALALMAWTADRWWCTRLSHLVYALAPLLGGLVWAVALVVVCQPTVTSVVEQLVLQDDNSGSSTCLQVQEWTGESCLVLEGRALAGTWFYLAQSLALEIFVGLTVRWV